MTSTTETVSFAQQFVDRVAKTPDRAAFRHKVGDSWQGLTWRQTKDKVWELAAGLVDLGVKPEQRVAIASSTRIEWILADLAVVVSGAATTTIYPSTAADDVRFILENSESVVLIAENADQIVKLVDNEPAGLTHVVLVDGKAADAPKLSVPVVEWGELADRGRLLLGAAPDSISDRIAGIRPESLSTLIYTSGTTGRPKGVRLVDANWAYEGTAVSQLGILSEDDVQYLWLPLSHVFGKMLIAMQIQLGFSTAVDGDLTKIVENLGTVKPTFMAGAPRIFEKVRATVTLRARGDGGVKAKIFDWAFRTGIAASRLRQQKKSVGGFLGVQLKIADKLVFHKIREVTGGNIRYFISGSAALSREVAEWFDAAGLIILEGYGLTETSAAFTVNRPGDTRIGTVGPPLPGSELRIAADGEIMARGGGVMRGYHNNAEASDEVLDADGWFATGDIGEIVDGYLRITDRKKDLIKTSGGKYVAPQKVEGVFKAVFPYASQIVVHGEGRKYVSALVTLDPDAMKGWAEQNDLAGLSAAELAQHPKVTELVQSGVDDLNTRLERWETVKKFAVLPRDLTIEDGELTPSLKVRRKAVEKMYVDTLDGLYPKD